MLTMKNSTNVVQFCVAVLISALWTMRYFRLQVPVTARLSAKKVYQPGNTAGEYMQRKHGTKARTLPVITH